MENGLAPSRHRTIARILVLVLGPATTVNRTPILVDVAVAGPEAEEVEYARAQRRGVVRGCARVSRSSCGHRVAIWGLLKFKKLYQ
jgi:hypothetical protein